MSMSASSRVKPSTAAEEIYVRLDELDSGSQHIRRLGKGSDVIGTKLRFRTGGPWRTQKSACRKPSSSQRDFAQNHS